MPMAQRAFGQANPHCRNGRDRDYQPWARALGDQACSKPQAGIFLIQLLSKHTERHLGACHGHLTC